MGDTLVPFPRSSSSPRGVVSTNRRPAKFVRRFHSRIFEYFERGRRTSVAYRSPYGISYAGRNADGNLPVHESVRLTMVETRKSTARKNRNANIDDRRKRRRSRNTRPIIRSKNANDSPDRKLGDSLRIKTENAVGNDLNVLIKGRDDNG